MLSSGGISSYSDLRAVVESISVFTLAERNAVYSAWWANCITGSGPQSELALRGVCIKLAEGCFTAGYAEFNTTTLLDTGRLKREDTGEVQAAGGPWELADRGCCCCDNVPNGALMDDSANPELLADDDGTILVTE